MSNGAGEKGWWCGREALGRQGWSFPVPRRYPPHGSSHPPESTLPSPRSHPRVAAAFALGLAVGHVHRAAAVVSAAIALYGAPAAAQPDPYRQHMDNGVKLFNDKNYSAATAEFQAAYEARPNANPLVNIALCEKALFHYPKAIASLESALAKHTATMDPSDTAAAADAIKEMQGLLGTVTAMVTPPNATLRIDGDEIPQSAAGKPIQLGPGVHKIEARAEGYAPRDQTVTVASGENRQVEMALAPSGPTVAQNSRAGSVPVPGGSGAPEGPIATHVDDPPQRRGLYLLGLGALLIPLTHPDWFAKPATAPGAAYGLRVGFQVNRAAGFDVSYEHSAISTTSLIDIDTSFRLLSDRFAASLRLSSSGKLFRAVGTIGGGVVVDSITYQQNRKTPTASQSVCGLADNKTWCPLAENPQGVNAFALVEVAAEFDIDHVLIDIGIEAQSQSTGNLTSTAPTGNTAPVSIYGPRPIVNLGPALRIGYRFW